ncbi:MAG: hypothetical protein H6707_02540 [Deltaproteobacteria bacterium]|nr:hypothetical protein [Deltaproteobacteria bacterium]
MVLTATIGCGAVAQDLSSSSDSPGKGERTSAADVWPGGLIPYYFIDAERRVYPPPTAGAWPGNWLAVHFGEAYSVRISDCFQQLESFTGLRFVPTQYVHNMAFSNALEIRLYRNDGTSFANHLGFRGIPTDYIDVSNPKHFCHEVMHKLGFDHTQQRSDRDRYVRVRMQHVGEGFENEFIKSSDAPVGDYDFRSAMHYNSYTFSKDYCPVIVRAPTNQRETTAVNDDCLKYIAHDSDPLHHLYIEGALTLSGNDFWLIRRAYCHSRICGAKCSPDIACNAAVASTLFAQQYLGVAQQGESAPAAAYNKLYDNAALRDRVIDAALKQPAERHNADHDKGLNRAVMWPAGRPRLIWITQERYTVPLNVHPIWGGQSRDSYRLSCYLSGGHIFDATCFADFDEHQGAWQLKVDLRWGTSRPEILGSETTVWVPTTDDRLVEVQPMAQASWSYNSEYDAIQLHVPKAISAGANGPPDLPAGTWLLDLP